MNWELVFNTNRDALLRFVSMLFAATGLAGGASVSVLPRRVRSAVLLVLRPAESAARRLIFVEARDLSVAPSPARAAPTHKIARGDGAHVPAFALFDPRKRFGTPTGRKHPKHGPRIFLFDGSDPVIEPVVEVPELSPDDPVDAARLCRRLQALKRALDDLPREARRLARWRMRCERVPDKPRRVGPLRPGLPPGHRTRRRHLVDEVLSECHALAQLAQEPPI